MEAPIKTQTKKEAGRVRVQPATDIWHTFLRMQNDVTDFGCADCSHLKGPSFHDSRSSQPKVQAKSVWVGKVILSSLLLAFRDRNGFKISEDLPRHWACDLAPSTYEGCTSYLCSLPQMLLL